MSDKIKIGISACLLGNNVRYNGGHQLDRHIRDTLGQFFDFLPVCPEVECGLPVPREAMRLVGDPSNPKLLTNRTGIDYTHRMVSWAKRRVRELDKEALCGFIFKKDSPSSGMQRVKVYSKKGMPLRKGIGMFARVFMDYFPRIPVEEDGRLHDPKLRENFIERIFALDRWRNLVSRRRDMGRLVDFHTREKLLLLSHSPNHYRQMGKLVAQGKSSAINDLFDTYEKYYMEALSLKATPAKNTNVLHHILGFFKKQLSSDEKREMSQIIHRYRKGLVPLIVPVTLANHYVRKYRQPYLALQSYLNPHPVELKLRNHV